MVESLKAKMAALDKESDEDDIKDPKAALAAMMAELSTLRGKET